MDKRFLDISKHLSITPIHTAKTIQYKTIQYNTKQKKQKKKNKKKTKTKFCKVDIMKFVSKTNFETKNNVPLNQK